MKLAFLILYVFFFFVCQILFSASLNAQEVQRLRAVDRHVIGWAMMHPFIAIKAKRITHQVQEVVQQLQKARVLDGDMSGGRLDAFKHTYWMACLSSRISPSKAFLLGRAHEKDNYIYFKRSKLEDAEPGDYLASEMDLWNNQIGVELGAENKYADFEWLQTLVMRAVREGKLLILFKNSAGKYLQCDGAELPMENYFGQCVKPKCLISSDR